METSSRARTLIPGASELIAKQRYKEALDLIKKKLKKSQDPAIFALRAQILLAQGDVPGCAQQAKELISRKPPITDPDTLNGLFATLADLLEQPKSGIKPGDLAKLWQDAISQQPSSSMKAEYALEWAQSSVELGLWSQLAQAAGAAQRFLPPNDNMRRQYFFRQQVGNWLDSTQPNTDSRMGMMVIRSLEIALKNAPDAGAKSEGPAGNWISNKAEFSLLKEIFLNGGNSSKLISLLDEKRIGVESESVALDSWGVQEARVSALWKLSNVGDIEERQRHASDCWIATKELLTDAREAGIKWKEDKFDYWHILISSLSLLKFPEDKSRASLELIDGQPQTRTKTVARLLYWRLMLEDQKSPENIAQLLEAFKSHITINAKNPLGADDSINEASDLSKSDEAALREHVTRTAASLKPSSLVNEREATDWVTADINALKCESAIQQIDSTSRSEPVILRALHVYRESRSIAKDLPKTARHPGDEAALVAARVLLRGAQEKSSQRKAVQAILLLTLVVTSAEHNYDARSLLISPLQSLGMYSLAAKHFKYLGVKSILHENNSARLHTRIGSMTPFKGKDFDALVSMREALKWFSDAVQNVPTYTERALDNQNYQQALQIEKFVSRLRNSGSRQLSRLESRRASRLNGTVFDETGLRFDSHPPRDGADDLRAFESNEADMIDRGPPPNAPWLSAMRTIDSALSLAITMSTNNVDHPNYATQAKSIISRTQITSQGLKDSLTAAELSSFKTASLIGDTVIHLIGKPTLSLIEDLPTSSTADLESLLSSISTSRTEHLTRTLETLETLKSVRDVSPFPSWKFAHEIYMFQDVDRALYKLLDAISTRAGKSKEVPASCKTIATNLQKEITGSREKLRGHAIECGGWLEEWWSVKPGRVADFALGDDEVGTVLKELFESRAETGFDANKVLGSMISSAKETVDAILRVKI